MYKVIEKIDGKERTLIEFRQLDKAEKFKAGLIKNNHGVDAEYIIHKGQRFIPNEQLNLWEESDD